MHLRICGRGLSRPVCSSFHKLWVLAINVIIVAAVTCTGAQGVGAQHAQALHDGSPHGIVHTTSVAAVVAQPEGSSANSRKLLQDSTCPQYCAPNGCDAVGTGGTYTCSKCLNTFEQDTVTGRCECAPGKYPTGQPVTCQLCTRGYWCPGTKAATQGNTIIKCADNMTTRKAGAARIYDCVNSPGYTYVSQNTPAVACGKGTYSTGYLKQKSCSSCPSGFTTTISGPATSSADCVLQEGYFMAGRGMAAPCPKGTWKAGYQTVSSCTACAPGVTTAQAGSTAETACTLLLPGYEAVTFDSASPTLVKTARACQLDAYCPGTTAPLGPGQSGRTLCDGGRKTQTTGSTSSAQCMIPPGYRATDNAITKCTTGYRSGWSTAKTVDCMPCGTGILTELRNSYVRVDVDGTSSTDNVAATPESCYILEGWQMIRTLDAATGSYAYTGKACTAQDQICAVSKSDGTLYTAKCNAYGRNERVYGLKVKPCLWCLGPVSNLKNGGWTRCAPCPNGLISSEGQTCVIPPGKAAARGTSVLTNTYTLSEVTQLLPCPAGYYCPGGPAPETLPTRCAILRSAAGATTQQECNVIPPGKASANKDGVPFLPGAPPPANNYAIEQLVSCPAGYYCPGGLAPSTLPVQCGGILGSAPGARQQQDCNVVPPGRAATIQVSEGVSQTVYSYNYNAASTVTGLVDCPEYYYCTGGTFGTPPGLPQACDPYTKSSVGATQKSECNLLAPGYEMRDAEPRSCKDGYYKTSWSVDQCTKCGENPFDDCPEPPCTNLAAWRSDEYNSIQYLNPDNGQMVTALRRASTDACYLEPGMGTLEDAGELTAVDCTELTVNGIPQQGVLKLTRGTGAQPCQDPTSG